MNCGSNESLKPTKAVTMEFWINPSSYCPEARIPLTGFSLRCGYTFWQYAEGGNAICLPMDLNEAGGQRRFMDLSLSFIPLNIWTHGVLIFDAENGKLTAYKNGNFFKDQDIVPGDIVYEGDFSAGNGFQGLSDEIRIYDWGLSEEGIKAHFLGARVPKVRQL